MTIAAHLPPPHSPRPAIVVVLVIVGIALGVTGLPGAGLFIAAAIVVAATFD